jgi:hypothetical protein
MPHLAYPEGPQCADSCPGEWSDYHDGYSWGIEQADAANRDRQAAEEALREWIDADDALEALSERLNANYSETGEQASDDDLLREATAEDRLNRAENAARAVLRESTETPSEERTEGRLE